MGEVVRAEGVGPYDCVGLLYEVGQRVRLPNGQVRQYFVIQVDTELLLMEAYDEVAEVVREMGLGSVVGVRFVIRGWRWYPPEREAKYLLRLVALSIASASL